MCVMRKGGYQTPSSKEQAPSNGGGVMFDAVIILYCGMLVVGLLITRGCVGGE